MNNDSIAPCGVICDLCLGFQREKNKCVGCNAVGYKPNHCVVCSIKSCKEKHGNEKLLCNECRKFPCGRIKNLDKRYIVKYGESIMQNFRMIDEYGIRSFIEQASKKWRCSLCGSLLCVHRKICLNCGSKNIYFPSVQVE